MTAATQLLDEIWQRPGDRQLLSVYADQLLMEGENTRAEYIQLCLLEERTAAQERRREGLRKRHRGAWLGAARRYVYTWEESEETPGFIARAQCSMVKLASGFELVRALGPRLVVSVTEPKAKREVIALASRPLGTLYGVALWENDAQWISDDVLGLLAPSMRGLRALSLRAGEARATEAGWEAVLANVRALEELELVPGWNPERWLELLLASPLRGTLRRLSVPAWLGAPARGQLAHELPGCEIALRDEDRSRFNRATGYYEWVRYDGSGRAR